MGNQRAWDVKLLTDTPEQQTCDKVTDRVTDAPREGSELIYIREACAPYFSVSFTFQIFISVSQELLKGIRFDMINTV